MGIAGSSESLADLWESGLDLLHARVGQATYGFLQGAQPLRYEQGQLVLAVNDSFQREWLNDHFCASVSACLAELAGEPVEVTFEVAEHAQRPPVAVEPEPTSPTPRHNTSSHFPSIPLNLRYTFDNFVVAASNRFAFAAGQRVAKRPAGQFNPLFLHSKVGLGKTHLLQAIGHEALRHDPQMKVVYVSAEHFVNHLLDALRDTRASEFRDQYRYVDLWLVDDIQFIAAIKGPASEEEFFHTFNTLYETSKQIVIASDRPPKQLQIINDRLRSRLEWGIVADIKPPEIETRMAILAHWARRESIEIPREAIDRIASHIKSNIRVLEGAFLAVCARSSLQCLPLTAELIDEVLESYSTEERRPVVTIERILETVSQHFAVSVEDMRSAKRAQTIVRPRHTAMYLARELTDTSLAAIGQAFGDRDHSTVLHAIEKVTREIQEDDHSLVLINDLHSALQEENQ